MKLPGAFGGQRLSVYLILDDVSTEATTQFASEVEFRKKSNIPCLRESGDVSLLDDLV